MSRTFPRLLCVAWAIASAAFLASCHQDAPSTPSVPCQQLSFEGSRFTVCAARRGETRLQLVDKDEDGDPYRRFDALSEAMGDEARHVAFAMNAGMFNDKGLPIGLYVERGKESMPLNRRSGPGNFHMLPNGVFYGDAAGWHVSATDAFARDRPDRVDFATQSGPMLVIDGQLHPGFSENGESLQLRNGVGVSMDGTAWFAISDEPVSFGRFARLFRDRLTCPDALFLDGSVSQLWEPATARRDQTVPMGPIVVALQSR